ncbi:ankyrin repeat domain-containing protein [Luteolibacter flavescens]|uniref:Ankyrin repeat domain-containing protein n=1 Tax=Luteolibacter flavescens TaxID=1859460 RepID=A0ABT3FRB0_9BACT|nr:ankyrin repeat domain-containing protein [Luteolibacter flavescens]MCW1886125.1 ankyrin repeat domain-containing protein [Luteolibacter flavescens]
MTRNPICRSGLTILSAMCLPLTPLAAQEGKASPPAKAEREQDLRELLREGLYTEEVTRDPEAAARQYEALLSRHDAQRAFAASALFRLAEVRRKQGRKDDAIALYQRLLARFPEAEAEGKLARENLATLGGKPAETGTNPGTAPGEVAPVDYEEEDIKRLRKLAETSPDKLRDPQTLANAIQNEYPKVVAFLLSQGADPNGSPALAIAAARGNLAICKLLLEKAAPTPEMAGKALAEAVQNDRLVILTYLLDQKLSPDSPVERSLGIHESPLTVAVSAGHVKAATLLLERKADANFMMQWNGTPSLRTPFGTPLHVAVLSGQAGPAMVRVLLEHGADPDVAMPETGLTPLHFATSLKGPDGDAMVKALLEKGADSGKRSTVPPMPPNVYDADRQPFVWATPFEMALGNEDEVKIQAMLAKGAKLDAPGSDGFTLLSQSIRTKNTRRFQYLLKAGADPNVANADGSTPLTTAIHPGDAESVKALLDAGADPDKPGAGGSTPLALAAGHNLGRPMVELLLAKGAKPDAASMKAACDASRFELVELLMAKGGTPEASVVKKAMELNRWDLVAKLLDGGAPLPDDSNYYPWETPLVLALQAGDIAVFEKMIARGAKLDEQWAKDGFLDSFFSAQMGNAYTPIPKSLRPELFRKYTLPRLETSEQVRLATHSMSGTGVKALTEEGEPRRGDSLAELLLAPSIAPNWPSGISPEDKLILWRKSGDAWQAVHETIIDGDGAFPAYQPGDIIELVERAGKPRVAASPGDGVPSRTSGLMPEMEWEIRRRISFPVTLEIGGQVEELTLRGDRLTHDPTSREVPLCTAGKLAALRWSFTAPLDAVQGLTLAVTRAGWPEVRVAFHSDVATMFGLQSGDRVKVEVPAQDQAALLELRKKRIAVRAAGLPYGWTMDCASGYTTAKHEVGSPPPRPPLAPVLATALAPTLCQILAETQVVPSAWGRGYLKDGPAERIPVELQGRAGDLTVLPHPDLSRIRILRLRDNGTEEMVEVDLSRIIAATGDDVSAEEVRKLDTQLQPGDVVELSVQQDRLGQPWKGLSGKEAGFLTRATQGRVQIIDRRGNIRLEEIVFRPPVFRETAAGWLPLSPGGSSQTVRASSWTGALNEVEVSRGGTSYSRVNPASVFFRDGDQMNLQRSR